MTISNDSSAHNQITSLTGRNRDLSGMRSRMLARTVRIETADGVVYRLTDWPEPIEISGKIYYPSADSGTPLGRISLDNRSGGIQFTQFRSQGAIGQQSTELEILANRDFASPQDVDSKVFDLAEVRVSSVDPRFPWVELPGGRLYVMERATRDSEGGISFDLVSKPSRSLRQRKGPIVSNNCDAEWGDARCFRPHEAGGPAPLREDEWVVGECEILGAASETAITLALPTFSNTSWELSPTDTITNIAVGNPTVFTTATPLPYAIGETFLTQVFGFGSVTPDIRGINLTATVTGTNTFEIDSGYTTSGTPTGLGSTASYYINLRTRVTFIEPHPWGGLVGRFLNVPLTVSGAGLNGNVNGTYRAGSVFVSAGNSLEIPVRTTSVTPAGGRTFVDVEAGWFNNGLMTITDPGSDRDGRVYTISQPEAPTEQPFPELGVEIELPRDLRQEPGTIVALRVGCTKRLEEDCALKFGNQINFRGRGQFSLNTTRMIQTPRAV